MLGISRHKNAVPEELLGGGGMLHGPLAYESQRLSLWSNHVGVVLQCHSIPPLNRWGRVVSAGLILCHGRTVAFVIHMAIELY